MKNNVFFGPAGSPVNYKGAAYKAPKFISEEGLDSYEYQSPYGVRIGESSASTLKDESKKHDVLVSMHGPYYINLCAKEEDKLEKSLGHLISMARAGEWMGAYRLVFHPGAYLNRKPEKAMEISKNTVNRLFEELESEGIEEFTFAPETTGKRTQQGNIHEIVELCATFDHFEPTIDFAHIHARGRGYLTKKDDYNCIFSAIEDQLDIDRLHCHFTTIEYASHGEVKHHTLDESDEYGPNIEDLLANLIDNGWKANIICETPLRDLDALKMKEKYENMK
ncbi:TIM barrel protein [uncultured Methanobrevibacter sp.]|uniref:TIM barrel protein n=1 Tax=uncultured Methanobrevibacter sp. TaxID=253161 RepID=UPI0025DF2F9C|nr:TIM barrel protein [uncultured Methanobrevibacter sp.]